MFPCHVTNGELFVPRAGQADNGDGVRMRHDGPQ
jgi:hypothetical protein